MQQRVQKREKQFRTGDNGRLNTPFRRKSHCSKLMVDGNVISGSESLLSAWTGYFKNLSRSRSDEEPGLKLLSEQVDTLVAESLKNEEMILDIPFSEIEVLDTVARLKEGKSAGPDALQGEHLKFGGNVV